MTAPARADRPSAEELLLLRAALLRERAGAESAWAAWSERVPEGRDPGACARLLPLACRNLARLGAKPGPRLKAAYLRALGSNGRLLQLAAEVVGRLARAGIDTLVLKGTALLVLDYRDKGARPMSDVDVLVPPAQLPAAVAALQAAGWQAAGLAVAQRTGMHAGILHRAEAGTLDLHWHASYEARFPGADDDLWAAARPLLLDGAPTKALGPADQLLHSLAHGLRWSIAPSCAWVADAATLVRGGQVDGERLASQSGKRRLTAAVREGLELVRSVAGPEPGLDALLARLQRERTSWSERVEHAYRVRPPGGMLGALPNLWFGYRRGGPSGTTPAGGFPGFLARAWGLEDTRALPPLLARKAWRRLRFVTLGGSRG